METTTIRISKETRNRLKDFGKKGESYDDILFDLLDLKKNHEYEMKKNGR